MIKERTYPALRLLLLSTMCEDKLARVAAFLQVSEAVGAPWPLQAVSRVTPRQAAMLAFNLTPMHEPTPFVPVLLDLLGSEFGRAAHAMVECCAEVDVHWFSQRSRVSIGTTACVPGEEATHPDPETQSLIKAQADAAVQPQIKPKDN